MKGINKFPILCLFSFANAQQYKQANHFVQQLPNKKSQEIQAKFESISWFFKGNSQQVNIKLYAAKDNNYLS